MEALSRSSGLFKTSSIEATVPAELKTSGFVHMDEQGPETGVALSNESIEGFIDWRLDMEDGHVPATKTAITRV